MLYISRSAQCWLSDLCHIIQIIKESEVSQSICEGQYFSNISALTCFLSELLDATSGYLERKRVGELSTPTITPLTSTEEPRKLLAGQWSGWEIALHLGQGDAAEWLVTTWIYLTHSPITVLLPQVLVSLPQAAHQPEFHWLPQRNIGMMALCSLGLLMNSLVWISRSLSCPYGHLDEADQRERCRCGRANESYCNKLWNMTGLKRPLTEHYVSSVLSEQKTVNVHNMVQNRSIIFKHLWFVDGTQVKKPSEQRWKFRSSLTHTHTAQMYLFMKILLFILKRSSWYQNFKLRYDCGIKKTI